jgi:hypothetical protein
MNTLELKGELHGMIADIQSESTLIEVKKAVAKIIIGQEDLAETDFDEEEEGWDTLTSEQQTQLQESIIQSETGQTRDLDDVLNELQQWLKQSKSHTELNAV